MFTLAGKTLGNVSTMRSWRVLCPALCPVYFMHICEQS